MKLSLPEQIKSLIERSKNILLITPKASGDSIGAMLALEASLASLGKEIAIVCVESLPNSLKFLPSSDRILDNITKRTDFIITLDLSKTKAESLSYKKDNDRLNILIIPKNGSFTSEDVSFSQKSLKYDLIITINCQNLEDLGMLYDKNAEIFYEVPIINIDHSPANEYFGQINLVDIKASSSSEILFPAINTISKIDENTATCLLLGIISETHSFQTISTTPKTLSQAAQLIEQGADQEKIIQHLFREKKLSSLKLWGRALARVRKNDFMIWTLLSQDDFEKTETHEDGLEDVMNEMEANVSGYNIMLILAETSPNKIQGMLRTRKSVNAEKIAQIFGGSGDEQKASFTIEDKNLADAEKKVIEKIKEAK